MSSNEVAVKPLSGSDLIFAGIARFELAHGQRSTIVTIMRTGIRYDWTADAVLESPSPRFATAREALDDAHRTLFGFAHSRRGAAAGAA